MLHPELGRSTHQSQEELETQLPTPGVDQNSRFLQAARQIHPKVTGRERGSAFSQAHEPEKPL